MKSCDVARLSRDPGGFMAGRMRITEKLWRDFFSDPSEWWDHRSEKENARYPDFKHKKTQMGLWLNGNLNPEWVKTELAAMVPGAVKANIFSWKRRLARYVKAGQHYKTLEFFQQMQMEGIKPDTFSFLPALTACASLGALDEGRQLHKQIMESGYEKDIYVASCLVDMYAKCGSIGNAWQVFNNMPRRNVVAWSAMILGYVKSGQGQKALDLFRRMQQEGVEPNCVTFVGVLNACGSVKTLDEGRCVHGQIIEKGYQSDVFVGSSLVDMYAKCGSMVDAYIVLENMPIRTVVAWSAIILGYVKCGQGQKALELFEQMQQDGVDPNHVTFVGVLSACASLGVLEEGRKVHEQIILQGCESNVYVGSSLVDMYAKCGSIDDAWSVFNKMPTHDAVAWNAIIQGHAKCGQGLKALELSEQMQGEGVVRDSVTFVGMVNACASANLLEEGRRVHEQIIQSGCESDVYVGSSLVDMYAKCGSIEEAWRVFSKMPARDVVAWSAIIIGHVKCGEGQKALELSRQMQREGVRPNAMVFVAFLNACASVAVLDEGRRVHEQIIQYGCDCDLFVGNSLIDMYAKCGSIGDARSVFNKMLKRNVVTWNAFLGGCATHGHAKEALGHFKQMSQEGVEIDAVTFMSLFSACNHVGLVDEGLHYFELMISVYSISATVEHYACMIDLLGRAGRLHEAEYMIKLMSSELDVIVWKSLLGACRVHDNMEIGERIANQVLALDPADASCYILLSNIYAAAGKWDSYSNIQGQMLDRGVKKQPGHTWIEVNNEVHLFSVDDQEHPQIIAIHAQLEILSSQIEEVGYVPDKTFDLHIEEEEKASHLQQEAGYCNWARQTSWNSIAHFQEFACMW